MSDKIDVLRQKTEAYLREVVNTYEVRGDAYVVRQGSTAVFLHPVDWTDEHTLLSVSAVVIQGVAQEGNEAMYEEMNKHNAKFIFGTLSWRESSEDPGTGMIIMEHNLLGEYMDLAEFGTCLTALAFTADELDDTFQAMFGGERWAD